MKTRRTQKKRTAARAGSRRNGNLIAGQHAILEMIAAGAPLAETLNALVLFIESNSPGAIGSILLLDRDGRHVRHGAAPSLPESYWRAIDGAEIGPRAGSCGTAMFRREPVVVEDIRIDPLWSDYRALAAPHRLRACWSVPIFDADRSVLGSLAFYHRKTARPTPKHWQLIELSAHTAAVAIARHRREESMRQSEERYRIVSSATNDTVWDWDLVNDAMWWNHGVTSAFGYDMQTVTNEPKWWYDRLHPDDRERVIAKIHAAIAGDGETWSDEYRFRRADGAYAEVLDRGQFIRDANGKPVRMLGAMQDITERKRAEQRVQRLNRTHEVLSHINSAIVRLHNAEQLFREACRIAVEHGQFAMAWIGRYDPDTQDITPVAWNSFEADANTLGTLRRSASVNRPEGKGTVGQAVRERHAVFCNDMEAAPYLGAARSEALRLGLRSVVTLPLVVGDVVAGVLVLYTRTRDFFDRDETDLLAQLAGDISFALEYIEKEKAVARLAYSEPLTGLSNRAALQTRLAQALSEAAARQQALALLLINLNNFRDINDSLGHHNGDLVLKRIADILRATLWESDRVACLGGDEFAVLLPRLADKSDIDLVVNKIRTSLERPVNLGGVPVNVEAALGISLYPDHGDSAELLWQHADVALRTAKEHHRPQLFYSTDIDHYDPQRLALIGEMRDAIERNELTLHYQPVIDVATGRAVAVEALVRWQHPVHGLLYPDRFIPLAERTALINPLARWVLTECIRQGRRWHAQGLPLEIAFNLSARNLLDSDLCDYVLEQSRFAGFPLQSLAVEITETAIMVEPERAHALLAELHAAGARIAMDDFGIGQSSLGYLKDLPIDKIKIDKSFALGYRTPRNAAIVHAAVELGHNLGLQVTAEGVEDEDTYLALRGMKCDFAQGYFFSRPVPADKLTSWLQESRWRAAV